jgi:hypothetical protein
MVVLAGAAEFRGRLLAAAAAGLERMLLLLLFAATAGLERMLLRLLGAVLERKAAWMVGGQQQRRGGVTVGAAPHTAHSAIATCKQSCNLYSVVDPHPAPDSMTLWIRIHGQEKLRKKCTFP